MMLYVFSKVVLNNNSKKHQFCVFLKLFSLSKICVFFFFVFHNNKKPRTNHVFPYSRYFLL